MNHIRLIFSALAIICGLWGCALGGFPDRRYSEVMVNLPASHDASLREDVRFGLYWWHEATHDTDIDIVSHCSYDRACTIVSFGELGGGRVGQTERWQNALSGNAGSHVTILPDLDPVLQRTAVAHELGHSFELAHVADDTDIMNARTNPNVPCISEPSLAQWRGLYGDNGKLEALCFDQASLSF